MPICELKIRAISKTEKLKGIKRDGTLKTLFTKMVKMIEIRKQPEMRIKRGNDRKFGEKNNCRMQ